MAIHFSCPHCNKVLTVRDSFAGTNGSCPSCKQRVLVPAAQQAPSATGTNASIADGSEPLAQDFFSQISNIPATGSHRSKSTQKGKTNWRNPVHLAFGGILGLVLVVVIVAFVLPPRSSAQLVLGVWQFEKETGGVFSNDQGKEIQPAVEFLSGGKMKMHNWRETLDGKWKMDETTTPPSIDFNWTTGSSLDHFKAIEFPTRDIMLLKTRTKTVTITAAGDVSEMPGTEVTLHFRRRSEPPKRLAKERISENEKYLQAESDEVRKEPPRVASSKPVEARNGQVIPGYLRAEMLSKAESKGVPGIVSGKPISPKPGHSLWVVTLAVPPTLTEIDPKQMSVNGKSNPIGAIGWDHTSADNTTAFNVGVKVGKSEIQASTAYLHVLFEISDDEHPTNFPWIQKSQQLADRFASQKPVDSHTESRPSSPSGKPSKPPTLPQSKVVDSVVSRLSVEGEVWKDTDMVNLTSPKYSDQYKVVALVKNLANSPITFDEVLAEFVPREDKSLKLRTRLTNAIELDPGNTYDIHAHTNGYTTEILSDAGGKPLKIRVTLYFNGERLGNPFVAELPKLGALQMYSKDQRGTALKFSEIKDFVAPKDNDKSAEAQKPKIQNPNHLEVDREKAAVGKLKLAKSLLKSNLSAGKKRLGEIVKDFPGTSAAKEAEELLNESK